SQPHTPITTTSLVTRRTLMFKFIATGSVHSWDNARLSMANMTGLFAATPTETNRGVSRYVHAHESGADRALIRTGANVPCKEPTKQIGHLHGWWLAQRTM